MSKRGSVVQGGKEDAQYHVDREEEARTNATPERMSQRKILAPKSRRGKPGGGDLSSLGNPFAAIDPNVNSGSAPQNAFGGFGNSNASQSFPTFGGNNNNNNSATQNSSFPPAQNQPSGNIFSGMNGGSSGFSFGGSTGGGQFNNPFAGLSQPQQNEQSTPKFNMFASSQPQPQPSGLFGSQPNGISAGTPQTTSAPGFQPSQQTSPNDMDMASPPSANKFTNSFGGLSQKPSSTPRNDIFGAGNKDTPQQPSLFSNASTAQGKTATAGTNIFGDMNKNSSTPSSSAPDLFGGFKPSADSTPKETPSSNPFANIGGFTPSQPSADNAAKDTPPNPFAGIGGFTPSKPNETSTSSSQPTSTLFPPASAAATPPATTNIFGGTPKTSGSIFDRISYPEASQAAPQTAPAKFKTSDNRTGDLFAGGRDQRSNAGGFAPSPSLFAPNARQHSAGASAAPRHQPSEPVDPSHQFRRMNKNVLGILAGMNRGEDWSSALESLLAAYQSTKDEFDGESAGAPSATTLGTKRKQQADPPDENAARASKLSNTTSTPSTTEPSKPTSETSKTFQNIFSQVNKPSEETNATSTSQEKSGTPQQGRDLFGRPSGSSENVFNKAPSSNIFGSSTGGTGNLFGKPTGGNTSAATNAANSSRTSGLFGNLNNTANTGSAAKGAPTSSLFGHLTNKPQAEEETEEQEESDDGETLENTLRNRGPAPGSGGSLFDRISGGPPPREASENPEPTENGNSVSEASAGDHTWTPDKTIRFGDSLNSTSTTPKLNGNLFGQSKSTSIFANSGAGLKPPMTNGPSRATTPGTDVDSANPSASEAETTAQADGDNEITGGSVDDKTAMSAKELEMEDVLYEVPKLRMMQFVKDGDEGNWNTRGTGPFRVLKNKESGKIRMLHRIAPRGHVLINSPLAKSAAFKKLSKGMLSLGAVGLSEKEKKMTYQSWTAKMKEDAVAEKLLEILKENQEK